MPSPNLLYARAMAYEELREIRLMEADLINVLLIDQKNANTLNALGYSLTVHTQRYDEAYALIYEAHLYDPGSAAILDSLGWVEYKRGNYADALKFIEASYEKDKDKEIILHYCEILIKNKSYQNSICSFLFTNNHCYKASSYHIFVILSLQFQSGIIASHSLFLQNSS